MLITQDLIAKYLEIKSRAWEPSTLHSESHRLRFLTKLFDHSPESVFDYLGHGSKYGRAQVMRRLADLCKTLKLDNPYQDFINENPRAFKNVYKRKFCPFTFEQVKEKIALISDPEARASALSLLMTGLRRSELQKVEDGFVIGKGGKKRKVIGQAIAFKRSNSYFASQLNQVGLTPHMLRKACATQLSRSGRVDHFDLCKIFGWSNIQTAQSYIDGKKEDELEKIMKEVL